MSDSNPLESLATPSGFEPLTPRLGIWCSILLSYEVLISRGKRSASLAALPGLAEGGFQQQ